MIALGISFAVWKYLLSLNLPGNVWSGEVAVGILFGGMALGAWLAHLLPKSPFAQRSQILLFGLSHLLLLVPSSLLPGCVVVSILGGVCASRREIQKLTMEAAGGFMLGSALLLPFVGVTATLVLATLMSGFLFLRSTEELKRDESDWRASALCSFFAGVFGCLIRLRANSFSISPVETDTFFTLVLLLSVITLKFINKTKIFQSPLAWVAGVACLSTLLLPGLLTPTLLPQGQGFLQVFGLFATFGLLLLPTVILCGSYLSASLLPSTIAAGLVGILMVMSFSSVLTLETVLAGAIIIFLLGALATKGLDRPKLLTAAGLAVLALVTSLVEGNRYFAPPEERLIDSKSQMGDTYALSRSSLDGDIRLRRNYHQVVQSVKVYKQLRRNSLLPIKLHGHPKKILIIGAGNAVSISAAIEQSPKSMTILDPTQPYYDFSKWFTSEDASKNTQTQITRVLDQPAHFFRNFDGYFDVVIIDSRASWSENATYFHSVEFLSAVRDHTYPDGVIAQWFMPYQWTHANLSRAVASWTEVFHDQISLFRADLMPEYPAIALVFRGGNGTAQKFSATEGVATHDGLLSNLPGLLSLFIADARGIEHEFSDEHAGALHASQTGLESTAAWERHSSDQQLGSAFPIRFLSSLSAEDGPSYGALLWTRGVLGVRKNDPTWRDDKDRAVKALGFDPVKEYPDAYPK